MSDSSRRGTLRETLARWRGEWIRWRLRLTSGGRVVIGPGLRAYGPLRILGTGRVRLGENVTVGYDPFNRRSVALQTLGNEEALIEIEDDVTLLGTHVSSGRRVLIQRGAWLEDARVMDSDFHETWASGERQGLSVIRSQEVVIGPGASVAGRAMILKGARVGARSRIRPGAVVLREVPDDATAAGFPARVVKEGGGEEKGARPVAGEVTDDKGQSVVHPSGDRAPDR